jgi:formate-dependent nitrite reductase membrane component NrfD
VKRGSPPEEVTRRAEAGRVGGRDVTPAVGSRGQPGVWKRAGDKVALFREHFGDARWSYLYGSDTRYAEASANGSAASARWGETVPVEVQGPVINAAVWTWEVPAYFFVGGLATGSAFVAVAADAAGDHAAAARARKIALGAVLPGAPLLIMDLGRPARFLNMLRIFKTRSPMSMGAWCLSAFSAAASGAVAADLFGKPGLARVLGANTALFGTYLGSYTGVLLASTATPLWARSRTLLPPIFICTATASGAAANRLLSRDESERSALSAIEAAAMVSELVLSAVNERRIGSLAEPLAHHGAYRAATWAVRLGLALRALRHRGPIPSLLFLAAAFGYRLSWVQAGQASARDDEAVARNARTSAPGSRPR